MAGLLWWSDASTGVRCDARLSVDSANSDLRGYVALPLQMTAVLAAQRILAYSSTRLARRVTSAVTGTERK